MAMNSNPLRTPRVGSEHNALGWGRRGRAGERGKEEKGGALGHAAQNSMRAYLRAWCSTGSRPSAGRTKWSVTSLPVRFGVGRGRLPAQRLRRAGPDLDRPDHPGRAHLLLLRHRRDPRQLGVRALRQGSGRRSEPPVLVSDRVLVPLRFLADAFGWQLGWDHINRRVTVGLN
jgi:hypothetical protein